MSKYQSTLYAIHGLEVLLDDDVSYKIIDAIYDLISNELSVNVDKYERDQHEYLAGLMEEIDRRIK